MGQSLIATIIDDVELAKIYYHSSGYYNASLREALKFITLYEGNSLMQLDKKLKCILIMQQLNGALIQEELKIVKNMYSKEIFGTNDFSKYNGLIAITKKGKHQLEDNSNFIGKITIDFNKRIVQSDLFSNFSDLMELEEERKNIIGEEYEPLLTSDLLKVNFNPVEIKFEDLNQIIEEIEYYSYLVYKESYYELV